MHTVSFSVAPLITGACINSCPGRNAHFGLISSHRIIKGENMFVRHRVAFAHAPTRFCARSWPRRVLHCPSPPPPSSFTMLAEAMRRATMRALWAAPAVGSVCACWNVALAQPATAPASLVVESSLHALKSLNPTARLPTNRSAMATGHVTGVMAASVAAPVRSMSTQASSAAKKPIDDGSRIGPAPPGEDSRLTEVLEFWFAGDSSVWFV